MGQRQRVNAAVIPEGGDGGGIKALLRLGEPVEGRQIPDRAPGGQVDGIGIAHKQRHIRPHTGHHRFDQARFDGADVDGNTVFPGETLVRQLLDGLGLIPAGHAGGGGYPDGDGFFLGIDVPDHVIIVDKGGRHRPEEIPDRGKKAAAFLRGGNLPAAQHQIIHFQRLGTEIQHPAAHRADIAAEKLHRFGDGVRLFEEIPQLHDEILQGGGLAALLSHLFHPLQLSGKRGFRPLQAFRQVRKLFRQVIILVNVRVGAGDADDIAVQAVEAIHRLQHGVGDFAVFPRNHQQGEGVLPLLQIDLQRLIPAQSVHIPLDGKGDFQFRRLLKGQLAVHQQRPFYRHAAGYVLSGPQIHPVPAAFPHVHAIGDPLAGGLPAVAADGVEQHPRRVRRIGGGASPLIIGGDGGIGHHQRLFRVQLDGQGRRPILQIVAGRPVRLIGWRLFLVAQKYPLQAEPTGQGGDGELGIPRGEIKQIGIVKASLRVPQRRGMRIPDSLRGGHQMVSPAVGFKIGIIPPGDFQPEGIRPGEGNCTIQCNSQFKIEIVRQGFIFQIDRIPPGGRQLDRIGQRRAAVAPGHARPIVPRRGGDNGIGKCRGVYNNRLAAQGGPRVFPEIIGISSGCCGGAVFRLRGGGGLRRAGRRGGKQHQQRQAQGKQFFQEVSPFRQRTLKDSRYFSAQPGEDPPGEPDNHRSSQIRSRTCGIVRYSRIARPRCRKGGSGCFPG